MIRIPKKCKNLQFKLVRHGKSRERYWGARPHAIFELILLLNVQYAMNAGNNSIYCLSGDVWQL